MPTENEFSRFCKDFDLRRPTEPPVKKTFWFEAKFEHDSDSINDLLRRFLIKNGIKYLNTMNGDVWFIQKGAWCRCDYEVSGDTVKFYLCEFNKEEQV